jgi:hypothetical protein
MKNLKYFLLTIGLIISGFFQLSGQGCDPQLTSVNVINRPSYCVTNNNIDFVELEMAWTMSGGNPLCVAPAGSWRVQVNMPLSKVYKVNSIADVTVTGPFIWVYDGDNNVLRGTNNVPISITNSGILKVIISGDPSASTTCNDISSIVNIEIVPNILGGNTSRFDNEIGNDASNFYLENRVPMTVTKGTITSCYPDLASAEAAAIAATIVATARNITATST